MRTVNLPTGAQRQTEIGAVWRELLTNSMGTLQIPLQGTFRVRATGATTVTIGGILAMTMSAGEIAIFNVGTGPVDGKSFVEVVIAGAAAFVQVAKEIETGRHTR